MFGDNKIPYHGRTCKNQEEPGTHKAVHISLLAVSTTYDVTRDNMRRFEALRAFILSYLIVCTFGRRRLFISDLKAVFDGV